MLTDVVLSCFPADHPKSEEYFSDPRLAAYAVPHRQAVAGYNMQFSWSLVMNLFAVKAQNLIVEFWNELTAMQ